MRKQPQYILSTAIKVNDSVMRIVAKRFQGSWYCQKLGNPPKSEGARLKTERLQWRYMMWALEPYTVTTEAVEMCINQCEVLQTGSEDDELEVLEGVETAVDRLKIQLTCELVSDSFDSML